jgi:membrane protein implicated in regulation of membrane protease activity
LLAVLLLILPGLILLQVVLLRMLRGTLNTLRLEPVALLYLISFLIAVALMVVICGYRFYRRQKQLKSSVRFQQACQGGRVQRLVRLRRNSSVI